MGVEQSTLGGPRRLPIEHALFRRAMMEALEEMTVDDAPALRSAHIEHAWDPDDCSPAFRVLRDRVTARRLPSLLTTDCIRGKKAYITGRHVWEIHWDRTERGPSAVVGLGTPQAPLRCAGYLPLVGSNSESWGWDLSNKRQLHAGKHSPYPAGCAGIVVPDRIYVILDMNNRTLSFATKDIHLGVAFNNLPQRRDRPLCLMVSAVYGNCDVRATYMDSGDEFCARLRPLTSQPQGSQPSRVTAEPTEGSSGYKFHHTAGSNIAIKCGGTQAQRIDALEYYDNGIVISSTALKNDMLFEVRLDSKVGRWYGALAIGATENSADKLGFPDCMTNCRERTTFMWSNDKIKNNGQDMTTVAKNLSDLRVGDRVGVMRKSDNSLHFFLNGVDIKKSVKTIPSVLYAVVDVYGQAEKVTLTGGTADAQTSNQERSSPDPVPVKVRMNNAVELLKDGGSDIFEQVRVVSEDIAKQYLEASDRKLRQDYGDHLAEIGAAGQLTKLLRRLMDLGMETKIGWIGIELVRNVFWNYCDASLKMAKAVARQGVLSIMLGDLDRLGPKQSRNEKRTSLVLSAVNILHNCAKATENRQVYRDLRAVERLVPFLKADRMEVVVVAILTLSYITDESQQNLLEADSKLIGYLIGMLRNAVSQPDLRGRMEGSTWSALEIAVGLGNIAANDNNKERMIEQGAATLFIDLMDKGGDMEQECAANALWALTKVASGREKVKGMRGAVETLTRLQRSGPQSVQAAARRVLLQLQGGATRGGATQGAARRTRCEYQQLCKTFKDSLRLGGAFFDSKFDKCYCTDCHAARGEQLYYTRGKPAKDYGIPVGWCRFGLKVPPQAEHHNAFTNWHVAFHGTRTSTVSEILAVGNLLMPGDVALGGKRLSEEDGHYNDARKPAGFDTKQIFVSPSMRYSGCNVYAKATPFEEPATKERYDGRVALQLCIRPDSYKVGPQTIGATAEIDPKISNQEIEWSTKERGSTVLYGLLVKMDKK